MSTPALRSTVYVHAQWRAEMAVLRQTIEEAAEGLRVIDAVLDNAGVDRTAAKRKALAARRVELVDLIAEGRTIVQDINVLYRHPAETIAAQGGSREVGTVTEHHQ